MSKEFFRYKNDKYFCEDVELASLAKKLGTPLYVYSRNYIHSRIETLQKGLKSIPCNIHYAVKANSNVSILEAVGSIGCGADIVSGGELFRCLKAGISAKKIVFSGVGKTRAEIHDAIVANIFAFNVESLSELILINDVAKNLSQTAAVNFRVNPNVNAKTHPYISTGLKENKFGFSKEELLETLKAAKKLKNIKCVGLSCHIGSQITDLKPLAQAWDSLLALALTMPFDVKILDLGGGLGITYTKEKEPSLEAYTKLIADFYKKAASQLSHLEHLGIEPGRSIVGSSGVLLSSVIAVKKRKNQTFTVVDAGMNDLIRPALYQAIHDILPTSKTSKKLSGKQSVVGPVCESADVFLTAKNLPAFEEGSVVAFQQAGAYGMSMASQYNSRPLPAEVLIDKNRVYLIKDRETNEDLVKKELMKEIR